MRIRKKFHLLSLPMLSASYAALFLTACQRYPEATYTSAVFSETADALDNPYQGWYRICRYELSDDAAIEEGSLMADIEASGGQRLVLVEINLKEYAGRELSGAALAQLDAVLSAWEGASFQLILRFLYDWDGNAACTEPQSEDIVLRHMEQAAQIVNCHAGAVYILQGIFIGDYGEMHGSALLDGDSIQRFTEHLASLTDPSIYLSVRTPWQWRTVAERFRPLTEQEAWQDSTAARMGLFNDGMLGSASDLGTYNGASGDFLEEAAGNFPADYSVMGSREEELAFQQELCQFVPHGGEVVADNSYNDIAAAVETLSRMRVSYLNCAYDEAALEKWEKSVYRGDSCFNGVNGRDYIGRHLGYRYAIVASDFSYGRRGGIAELTLSIKNSGFSGCYRAFDPQLAVKDTESGDVTFLPIDSDTRLWFPGRTALVTVPLDIPDIGEGTFEIYFTMDDPATGLRIALANGPGAEEDGYLIGHLEVGR